ADGVQQLCGERGGLGRDLVGIGVVPGVPITFEEGEYLDGVDAACHDRRGVAVGGKEPVVLVEHQGSAGLAGLLPVGGGVDGQASLADEGTGLFVDTAAHHQGRVRGEESAGVGDRQGWGGERLPRGVEQLQWLLGGEQVLLVGHAPTSVCLKLHV